MASSRKKPRTIYRCDWPRPRLLTVGIFGPSRDFPITTKELASLQKRQQTLFVLAASVGCGHNHEIASPSTSEPPCQRSRLLPKSSAF